MVGSIEGGGSMGGERSGLSSRFGWGMWRLSFLSPGPLPGRIHCGDGAEQGRVSCYFFSFFFFWLG